MKRIKHCLTSSLVTAHDGSGTNLSWHHFALRLLRSQRPSERAGYSPEMGDNSGVQKFNSTEFKVMLLGPVPEVSSSEICKSQRREGDFCLPADHSPSRHADRRKRHTHNPKDAFPKPGISPSGLPRGWEGRRRGQRQGRCLQKVADGQRHPLTHRRHKGESRGPVKNPNWLEPLRRKRGAPSLHPSPPCQGSSAKKVVSCRVRFRFNPCKNQLRSTRGDLVRALLEVLEGFCYCNQTPNVPIPFCWESEVIYTLLNILRRSQELPSLCIPCICLCSSLRQHAAGNSSGGYRSGLGKKHSLYHPEITQSCPRQGLALCLSAYTAVFHPAPFVLCIWLCFSCATPTQEAKVKARSRAPEHSSAFLERGRTHLLRIPTGRHSHKLWRADAPCTPLHCWGMLQ